MSVKVRIDTRAVKGLSEPFRDLAQNFPVVRRQMAWRIARFARGQATSTYELDLPLNSFLNYKHPTVYRGEWGRQLRIFVTPQGTITIRADGPAAEQVESGSGPRQLDVTEKAAIREWATTKLGVSDPREIAAIISKIQNVGIFARRLFHDAFHPSTPRGQLLDRFINEVVDQDLRQLLAQSGFDQ